MRIMGLDFGSRTVGVAVSDPLFLTAQGVEIIRRKSPNKLRQTLARIEELITEYEVAEEEEEDSVAYILKEIQTEEDDVVYEMVEDDVELNAIAKVFAEMLEDVDFA